MQIPRNFSRITILAFFILSYSISYGETVEGRVISVTDGDTLTILTTDNTQMKIRLAGIDAPERRQSYGEKSKEHLASLIYQKIVSVEHSGIDKYQRTLGKIFFNELDINLEQISHGFAWHYRTYAKNQSIEDQNKYSKAEATARQGRKGLWQEEGPQPPWEYRRGNAKSSPPETKTDHRPVKLSKNGICHEPRTAYYERTLRFKPFATLTECISSGGRLPH